MREYLEGALRRLRIFPKKAQGWMEGGSSLQIHSKKQEGLQGDYSIGFHVGPFSRRDQDAL